MLPRVTLVSHLITRDLRGTWKTTRSGGADLGQHQNRDRVFRSYCWGSVLRNHSGRRRTAPPESTIGSAGDTPNTVGTVVDDRACRRVTGADTDQPSNPGARRGHKRGGSALGAGCGRSRPRVRQEHQLGLELQNQAAEIRLHAERKAGDMLREMQKHKGGRPSKTGNTLLPVLEDLGITKIQSCRWQRLARVPQDSFAQYVASTNRLGEELTAAGLLRLNRQVGESKASTGSRKRAGRDEPKRNAARRRRRMKQSRVWCGRARERSRGATCDVFFPGPRPFGISSRLWGSLRSTGSCWRNSCSASRARSRRDEAVGTTARFADTCRRSGRWWIGWSGCLWWSRSRSWPMGSGTEGE